MLAWLEHFLIRYPELALFLVISVGYCVGTFKIGQFSLGPVTGSLFAGIFVGQFAHVPISGMTKSFLFLLFLFGIGYSVGPQFMQAMKRDGLKPMLVAVVISLTGLAAALVTAKMLGLDPGFSAGLLSGALTQSPAMGTATDAINALPLPEADRARLVAHIAVADAVCYIFGAAGVILFCSVVAPAILKIDLKTEAAKLEQQLGMDRATPDLASAWRKFELRVFRLPDASPVIGASVADAEARFSDDRLFIHRIRRECNILEADSSTVLHAGDLVALSGPRQIIVELIGRHAEEVEDKQLLDVPIAGLDVLLINRSLAGRTLGDIGHEDWTRGIYLRSLSRGGQEIPIAVGVVLQRGDVLRLIGRELAVKEAAAKIGAIIAPSSSIDFVVLGLAIFLGGVAGVLLSFPIGGVKISLSTSVGTLLAGLVVGHMRTRYPRFGGIPDDAIALMTSLGLAAFVGLTGLHAGPIFFKAVAESGIGLLLGGMVVTLTPQIIGLLFGRYVLRMNPILLLGALSGGQTMTAAMAAVKERSGSPVAVLGYTPAYPIGNILLTTWGTVMVAATAG